MITKDLNSFEKLSGITFKDKGLLTQAFLHRSYLNEHPSSGLSHNERLEFLGDAVLELVVTDHLYRRFPEKDEGYLTSYRAALVNATTLARAANALSMNDFLFLSKGEAKDLGKAREYILANTFEAVIGAVYMDQGYDATKEFLEKHLLVFLDEILDKKLWLDAKSHFQEQSQGQVGITPAYKVMGETGPDHDKIFRVGAFLGEELVSEGEGKSKQEAEQAAARAGLTKKGWLEE